MASFMFHEAVREVLEQIDAAADALGVEDCEAEVIAAQAMNLCWDSPVAPNFNELTTAERAAVTDEVIRRIR